MEEEVIIAPSISSTGRYTNTTNEKCNVEGCENVATYELQRIVVFGRSGQFQGVRCEEHKSLFFF